ncbi:MAG TPA: hypothetical protein VMR96_03170, partial [Solirubrobacterales bacterium]|nr:hypothetical protein [Solirubrobacterales bacterium]
MTRWAITMALALAALLSLGVTVAPAATTRIVEASFNGSDSPGGAFALGPFGGVAVDHSGGSSNGDLYVGETDFFTHASRVVKFDSSGAYASVEFNGDDTPAGSFAFLNYENPSSFELGSLAVDGSAGPNSGDVYVSDPLNRVVDRFGEDGEFICQITGKVPSTPAEEAAECAGATGSATPGGSFLPIGATVDPVDGDVYVGNFENHVVNRFNAAGEYVGQIADPRIVEPSKMATDSNGNLYVNNSAALGGGTNVIKFAASGAFVGVIDEKQAAGLAVDPASNRVFVYEAEGGQIAEYDESGSLLLRFGSQYDFPATLAAGEANEVYAVKLSFAGSSVEIYSPSVIIPDATAEPASEVEETSATLNGEVDPAGGGDVEACEFEYGPDTSYGSTVPCSPVPPYTGVTSVSAEVSGLQPSVEYHYRLAAANATGVDSYSQDEVMYTKGAPTVEAHSAKEITRETAEIEATINPHGYSTDWIVEYVDKAQYEVNGFDDAQATTPETIGAQLTPQTVSTELNGLEVETTYYYRVVATNSVDSAVGTEESFTTVPIVGILGLYPSAENTTVTMRENVNTFGLTTSCHVEYVLDSAFAESEWAEATTVPCNPVDLDGGSKPVRVKTKVTGLAQNTTYHSRFVFGNTSGTLRSPDRTFTTFGLQKFTMAALDEEGDPVTQAGSHPYEFTTELEVNENIWKQTGSGSDESGATATLKDIRTELPPGLIGNPNGLPQCEPRLEEASECPPNTQVGGIAITLVGEEHDDKPYAPLFNLVPPKGVAAKFGAVINVGISAYIEGGVRTGKDYGINADSLSITSFANAGRIQLKLWGNPGDPGHTVAGERACPAGGESYEIGCSPAGLTQKPFLSMPTSCTGEPLTVNGSVNTYQEPQSPISISTQLPTVTGCNAIEFDPSIEARPTTNVADSPTGLHVDLSVPQNEDEGGLRVADLRDAKVTLPPGLFINPSGANGLEGCSSAAFDQHGPGAGHCPDASKVGTTEVDTPLVGHALPGSIYIATPYDNPFNSLLAIYLEVNDPVSGVIVKLAGHVVPDPNTGQLTTTFDENPQLPFNHFKLDFFKGAKAPLRTPAVCGTYKTTSVLTPWSAPDSGGPAEPSDSFPVSQNPAGGLCPTSADALPNRPSFEAGTVSPRAGAYSPLVMHLRREDGSQEFENLTVTPPPGLLAKLAGTAYCPEADLGAAASRPGAAEAAAPSCPANSEVGTVNVGAGAGPAPYYVQGHAYLAGPYKGAPLSLAVVTPAAAGPYDLGTVVVRVALRVDPVTTKITAVSDPLPRILKGVPLDIRSIALELGKPQFTLNPTSC